MKNQRDPQEKHFIRKQAQSMEITEEDENSSLIQNQQNNFQKSKSLNYPDFANQTLNEHEQDQIIEDQNISNASQIYFLNKNSNLKDQITLKEMPFAEILNHMKNIFLSSLAVSLGMLLQFTIISINLHLVGKLNNTLLIDAVGFGYLIINCTGGFLLTGYNQGLGAFIGRAHGNQNQPLIQQYFSQGFLVFLLVFALFSLIIFNIASILINIGQMNELAVYTQYFTTSILLGIFFNYYTDLLRNYLNGQQIFGIPMLILCMATGFHYALASYLFNLFELLGIIYATNITYIVTFLTFKIYIFFIGKTPLYEFKNLFLNFKEYLQETSAIAFPVQMDFIAFELNGIFIGTLHNLEQFAAHLALANFVSLFYSFPTGLGGALMYLTSNAMGENNIQKAKNNCILAYILSFIEGIFFFIIMKSFGREIGQFYLQDDEILDIFVEVLNIYTICVIADNIQSGISGIVKGIGKAKEALVSFTVAYFCIGTPLSCFMGFYLEMEVYGFWYGFDVAIFTVLIFLSYILYKTDFKKQVNFVQENIKSTSNLI